jgi:acetyl-CoA carboxylase biotin carboxylase subunit
MVTGIDLVKWQIRTAAGELLTLKQKDIVTRGHAIECRINAEDVTRGFAPVGGTIDLYLPPGGPGVRVDSHIYSGYTPPPNYDSLLGKIMAYGQTRTEAIARMRRALAECIIVGPATTIPFHRHMLEDPRFLSADLHTGLVADWLQAHREESAARGEQPASPTPVVAYPNGAGPLEASI